jgi:hypothetical protein
MSVSFKDFLPQNKVTTLEHRPYSPDLAQAYLYVFHRLISAFKGRHLFDATDIIKNATKELKKAFTKWLAGMFPTHLQLLAEVCSCTD